MRIQQIDKYTAANSAAKKATGIVAVSARWFSLAFALVLLLPALNAYGQFESASVLGSAKAPRGIRRTSRSP